jgi:AraC-like DNA-binding protein
MNVNPRVAGDRQVAPLVFSTRTFAPRDQFDALRSFMAPVVELDVEGGRQSPFLATHTVWDVGSFAMTRARMPAGRVRTWSHLRKNALDHWCFVVVDDAPYKTGRSLFYRSLADPFEGRASDAGILSVLIPRDLFSEGMNRIDGNTSVPDEGLVALLADYFISLERLLPSLSTSQFPHVRETTRAMIAACVRPSRDRLDRAQGAIGATLMGRARTIVRDNLAQPDFGPDQLARSLGVSRSRLYRLFEPHGGVARYVHRQRMLAAHAALSDPAETRPVGRIAEALGYHDASGFSRGFKQEFGYSPSEARVSSWVPERVPLVLPRQNQDEADLFARILLRL